MIVGGGGGRSSEELKRRRERAVVVVVACIVVVVRSLETFSLNKKIACSHVTTTILPRHIMTCAYSIAID